MYKYNILEKLRKLSVEDYQISWEFFPEALSITKHTWKKWIYLKKCDPAEIRLSQLQLIASFFDCSISELINDADDKKEKKKLKQHFNDLKLTL